MVEVDMKSDKRATVHIDEKNIAKLIGKKGKTIDEVERKIGISIGVETLGVKEPGRHVHSEYRTCR